MKNISTVIIGLLCVYTTVQAQTTVLLSLVQDNTMFSENGANSNGSGEYLLQDGLKVY